MYHFYAAAISTLFIAQPLKAVTGSEIQARYSLIGVISADSENKNGIVVLKDRYANRSLTLKEGQPLPEDNRWIVESVFRNAIELQQGREKVRVDFSSAGFSSHSQLPSPNFSDANKQQASERQDSHLTDAYGTQDHSNHVQYVDALNSDEPQREYRSEVLQEYERQLVEELERIRESNDTEEWEDPSEGSVTETDQEQLDPVFTDLPDGPKYFN